VGMAKRTNIPRIHLSGRPGKLHGQSPARIAFQRRFRGIAGRGSTDDKWQDLPPRPTGKYYLVCFGGCQANGYSNCRARAKRRNAISRESRHRNIRSRPVGRVQDHHRRHYVITRRLAKIKLPHTYGDSDWRVDGDTKSSIVKRKIYVNSASHFIFPGRACLKRARRSENRCPFSRVQYGQETERSGSGRIPSRW
jgi:hypothetical protein